MWTEKHFWGNVEYPSNEAAKAARDAEARRLTADGHQVRRTVLRDQLRPYSGFGQPDGRIGHVYIVRVSPLRRKPIVLPDIGDLTLPDGVRVTADTTRHD